MQCSYIISAFGWNVYRWKVLAAGKKKKNHILTIRSVLFDELYTNQIFALQVATCWRWSVKQNKYLVGQEAFDDEMLFS